MTNLEAAFKPKCATNIKDGKRSNVCLVEPTEVEKVKSQSFVEDQRGQIVQL